MSEVNCEDCGIRGESDPRLPADVFDGCMVLCRSCIEKVIRQEPFDLLGHGDYGFMKLRNSVQLADGQLYPQAKDGRAIKWFR